jgi:hypothetical protein
MKQNRREGKLRCETPKIRAFTGHVIYEEYSIALPARTKLVTCHLSNIREIFRKLFSDENFLTLLQAEAVATIPAYLRPLLEEARSEHEIQ